MCVLATAWAKDETTATLRHASGFRQVAAKHWFCKAWELHLSSLVAVDDSYDLSMTLSIDGGKFKALAVYGNLRQGLPRVILSTLSNIIHNTRRRARCGLHITFPGRNKPRHTR